MAATATASASATPDTELELELDPAGKPISSYAEITSSLSSLPPQDRPAMTTNSSTPAGTAIGERDQPPPLAALFVIYFDIKAGYTIVWKRAAEGVDLEGVEFKSLPSGLHNLSEDLVYFVHEKFAGVSAFVNMPAAEENRNALMVSVGILVPLSYGRLGRSWRHAEKLKSLARQYGSNTSDFTPFEEYYTSHALPPGLPDDSPVPRSKSFSLRPHTRARSVSDGTLLSAPGTSLSPFHPALSLTNFFNVFGPLVFPLYRAALLRKRILLITSAPVESACNFVYDISILSNIPLSVVGLLSKEASRLKPLFSVGVHDIPFLEQEAKARKCGGEKDRGEWVACSTDGVLHIKKDLYDFVVTLPPSYNEGAQHKIWPKIEYPPGTELKATQRDLRRYRALKRSLRLRYRKPLMDEENNSARSSVDEDEPQGIEDVCEKLSWREIAYEGFIWWASAGEKRSDADSDAEDLLGPSPVYRKFMTPDPTALNDGQPIDEIHTTGSEPTATPPLRRRSQRRRSSTMLLEGLGSEEMDLIAYFHRSTQRVLKVLGEIFKESQESGIEESGIEDEGDGDEVRLVQSEDVAKVFVSLEDVENMGLDRWSEMDSAAFVKELAMRWWGREVEVETWRWSCCGIECGGRR